MKRAGFAVFVVLLAIFYITTNAQSRIPGNTIYVSSQGFLNTANLKPVYKTIAEAFKVVKRGDIILVYGKLREDSLITPLNIADVTIRGMGTRTRPGVTAVPNGLMAGGADWANGEKNKTNPLLTIISAGWSIENMHFSNTANITSVRLDRNGSTRTANYTQFIDCAFYGGIRGIEDNGGSYNVGIYNSLFYKSVTAIGSTSTGQALPLMWEIIGNRFVQNQTHIRMPLSNSTIKNNILFKDGYENSNLVAINLSGGKNNVITQNNLVHSFNLRGYVNRAYLSGTGDAWGPNYYSGGEVYGVPRE